MATDDKPAFVAAVLSQHGERLRRFLASRIRNAGADINDLTQEVYLRLLRVPHHQRIKNPQAYLITVAHHVLHQHNLHLAATPQSVDIMTLAAELDSGVENDPAAQLETRERLAALDAVLERVSPRVHATFVLHRRFGFSLGEIGVQLGVSRPMVKKYLAKAMAALGEHLERADKEHP